MNLYYVLDQAGRPCPADLLTWAAWFSSADRTVAHDVVGGASISTVFLGLDHRHGRPGPPILYETMVFGGPLDEEQRRYATREQALSGHAEVLTLVLASQARGIRIRET